MTVIPPTLTDVGYVQPSIVPRYLCSDRPFSQGPQSLMPLMKALGVDRGAQLAYPSMWANSKQQDTSNVPVHAEIDREELSTL